MLIIVEGCDGVGKTTFAELLAELIAKQLPDDEVHMLHYGVPNDHPLVEYILNLAWYHPGQGKHLIIDRLHWGEAIYGPLYRGKSLLGEPGMRTVDLFLRERGGLVVYLNPDEATIRRNLTKRGENYLKKDDVSHVIEEYIIQYLKSTVPTMRIDHMPTQVDAKNVISAVQLLEENV